MRIGSILSHHLLFCFHFPLVFPSVFPCLSVVSSQFTGCILFLFLQKRGQGQVLTQLDIRRLDCLI